MGQLASIFTTFPDVAMSVGGEMLCVRSDRYPERPIVGKGIMIFTSNIPDKDPLVAAPDTDEVLFETKDGNTSLPGPLGQVVNSPPWASLVQQVIDLSTVPAAPHGGCDERRQRLARHSAHRRSRNDRRDSP